MKLYLNATGFIFVIGYDKQIIHKAISGELGYEDEVTALDYLEEDRPVFLWHNSTH